MVRRAARSSLVSAIVVGLCAGAGLPARALAQAPAAGPAAGGAVVTMPVPAVGLTAGSHTYRVLVSIAPGQTRQSTVTVEIKDNPAGWAISESAVMGEPGTAPMVVDTTVVDKATQQTLHRLLVQGSSSFEYAVKDGKATGKFAVNGQARPFSVEVGGPIFNAGAGTYQSLATLPLGEGYSVTFRTFDVQTQALATFHFESTGTERITVPAGTFDVYRAELTDTRDGSKTTLWVAKSDRRVVKFVTIRARPAGASVTSELVKSAGG